MTWCVMSQCSARVVVAVIVDGNYVAKLKGNQFVGTIYGEAN